MGGIAIKEKAFGTINTSAGEVQVLAMSHRVFASGAFTTLGGDTAESIPVSGCLAADLAFVWVKSGTGYVVQALAGIGAIAVTMDQNPGAATVLGYILLRAL